MVMAWAGRFGLGFVEDVFAGTGSGSFVLEVCALGAVIFAVYLLVRIDWKELISKKD
jgi:hypothetical protein